jgi:hypothetical protein
MKTRYSVLPYDGGIDAYALIKTQRNFLCPGDHFIGFARDPSVALAPSG